MAAKRRFALFPARRTLLREDIFRRAASTEALAGGARDALRLETKAAELAALWARAEREAADECGTPTVRQHPSEAEVPTETTRKRGARRRTGMGQEILLPRLGRH